MSKVVKRPISPRQKMINLMYVVLMAMLALNVSSDVLKGFALVEESLSRTAGNVTEVNKALLVSFAKELAKDPVKVGPNYRKAQEVVRMTDSLYAFIDELKLAIAVEADGKGANVHALEHAEDLEAAPSVMLAPVKGRGSELFEAINSVRARLVEMAQLKDKRLRTIYDNLSTDVPPGNMGKKWQQYMFEDMPAAAAITMLTKIQNDLRYAEGEVIHSLAFTVGVKDTLGIGEDRHEKAELEKHTDKDLEQHKGAVGLIPVNEVEAFVIPSSRTVVAGSKFTAEIVMASIDKQHRPVVQVGGRTLAGSHYEALCATPGDYTLSGHITMLNAQGQSVRREFKEPYTVVAPAATVSADLMNVLYAGYDNPVSVSVPGVPSLRVQATLTGGGTMESNGPGKYTVRPATPGKDVTLNVVCDGITMAQHTFRVRRLPDPTAYINIGGEAVFGGKIAKGTLLAANQVGAAIDDGLLHIPFAVTSFKMVFHGRMGEVIPVNSNGTTISEEQKSKIRELGRGKRLYITDIHATGPDKIARVLKTATEVIIQ